MNSENYWHKKYDQLAKADIPDWQKGTWWYEYIVDNQKKLVETNIKKYFTNKKLLIADIGCGPGTIVKHLGKNGHSVLGIDFSIDLLNAAKNDEATSKYLLIGGNASMLPLKMNI